VAGRDHRYLLHLWRESDGDLRASLRNVADGELRQFTGLDELRSFLETSTGPGTTSGPTPDDAPVGGG
jgi:hypothetical protein